MKLKFGAKIEGWKNFTPTQIKVAGIQYRAAAAMDFVNGCARATNSGLQAWVTLRPDPHNEFDPNAVKVIGHWQQRGLFRIVEKACHIGFLPAELAAEAAPLVSSGQMRARLISVYQSPSGFTDVNIIPVIPN